MYLKLNLRILKSWAENILYPTHIIKYEDLISDTYLAFKKVINFINKVTKDKNEFDEVKAKACVKNCDFTKLKNLENQEGFEESITKKNSKEKLTFFNLGKNNNFQNILEKKILVEMNSYYKKELSKYNYT